MKQRKLSRRAFLQSSAMAAIGVGVAACVAQAPAGQSGSEGGEAATENITLTFIVDTINEGHVKVRDKWAQEFMEANPGVTIDHQPIPQEYTTKIQTLMAAGTPADIYRYLQEVTPIITVHEKKMHLQIDDYIARDDYDIADYRPDAIALYQWEGNTYALPRDYGNQNLFYNLDLLDAEGIEKPPVDWEDKSFTFERFLEIAQALTKKNGDRTDQWGFLVNRGQRPWASWVYSNGGALVHMDDRGVATDCALTDEASVEALQFLQDLMYTYEVAPQPDLESELGGFELFASGKVGIMLTNPSAVNRFRTIESFKWDVGTLPIGKADRRGTGGGGTGWAAAAATKHPDVAWKFLAHISSAQAELDEVSVGATTPSRVSVVTSEAFLDPNQPPANAQGFAQAQEYVVRDPVHVRWPEITQRIYNPKMDLLWSGAENAAAVAQMIKEEADPLFAA
ncbi:MAG: sugar ABC transporter substrate-binding protein [Caldilineaceae bacterium]